MKSTLTYGTTCTRASIGDDARAQEGARVIAPQPSSKMSSEAEPLLLGRRARLGGYKWLPAVTSVGLLAVVSLSGYIAVDSLRGVERLQAGAPGYGKHTPDTKADWIKHALESGTSRIHNISRLIAGKDADEDASEQDASDAPGVLGYDWEHEPPVDEAQKQAERARLIEMDAATRMPYELESRAAEVQQVQSMLGGKPQLCSSCAVVIPSDVLSGNKMGQLIDSHECVLRFNAHAPDAANAEDWGTKDDIRVVNPMRVDSFISEGPGHCIDGMRLHMPSLYLTWETGSALSFIGTHPYAELLPNVAGTYWPGDVDVHDELRGWATAWEWASPCTPAARTCHPDAAAPRIVRRHDHLRCPGRHRAGLQGVPRPARWNLPRARIRRRARVLEDGDGRARRDVAQVASRAHRADAAGPADAIDIRVYSGSL